MNRGVFESSLIQQVVEGSPTWWWSMSNHMRPPPQPAFPLLPSSSWSSSSSPVLPQHLQPSNIPMTSCQDSQYLPDSWCQLLMLEGLVGEEGKINPGLALFRRKMLENCEDDQVYPSATGVHIGDLKQDYFGSGHGQNHGSEEIHASRSTWSQILPASSPSSCITTSRSTNMLDFSNKAHHQPDNSCECNSTETAPVFKKSRIQDSSRSTLKVRKERLGDRITALHQLVSPFGKTDTASVLLEAIGYIRFLHGQIEALSSPYLHSRSGSGNMKQPERNDEVKKDLRSRGLCLVPLAFSTVHVERGGDINGADFWAPALGSGGFR